MSGISHIPYDRIALSVFLFLIDTMGKSRSNIALVRQIAPRTSILSNVTTLERGFKVYSSLNEIERKCVRYVCFQIAITTRMLLSIAAKANKCHRRIWRC